MSTMTVLIIVFCAMILAPIIIAWLYYLATPGIVMKIDQDKVKDERYFAHSFAEMIEGAIESAENNEITLSRKEHFMDSESLKNFEKDSIDEMLLVMDSDFFAPEHIKEYQKEIYVKHNAFFNVKDVSLRAAYAAGKMVIGNKTKVSRWIDSDETLAVYDDCDLGVSATAAKVLSLGQNVTFKRLFAPTVYFGQYPDSFKDPMEGKNEFAFRLPIIRDKKNITYVTSEKLTEFRTAPYSIVTPNKTMIVEGAILQGDIHTVDSVRICEGSGVLGNIFSEGDILIERGSFVAGNVFSQENIEIESDVMIGKKDNIVSVVARGKITIKENSVVYGYVSCEQGGISCPLYSEYTPRHEEIYNYIKYKEEVKSVGFNNLHEYESADPSAYRMDAAVKSAIIPDGAKVLGRSMFCGCSSLESIVLPISMEMIDDFALADCVKLEDLPMLKYSKLKIIGVSALENCKKIKSLCFPKTLEVIKGAGCAGMEELESLSFEEGSNLKIIADHAFRDCKKLKSIELPDSVYSVGISAFRGCEGLKKIEFSEKIKDEPGIKELPEILNGVELIIRKA